MINSQQKDVMYQILFEHNHDGIMVLSESLEIIECNKEAAKLFKKKKTALLHKNILNILPHKDKNRFKKICSRVMKKGSKEQMCYLQAEEDVFIIDVQLIKIKSDSYIELLFHVFSYKNEIEHHLRLAETSNRTFLEMMNDDVFVIDPSMKILYLNEHASKEFHINRNSIVGMSLQKLFPKNAKHIRQSIKYVLDTKKSFSRESKFIFPNGSERWFQTELIPIMKNGNVTAILGVSHDITKRLKDELKIIELEKKYETLVQKSSDGVIVVQEGKIVFVNQRIGELLKIPIETMFESNFFDFVVQKDRALLQKHIQSALKKGVCNLRCEFALQSKKIESLMAEAHGSLIDFEGKPAIMVMIRDVTKDQEIEKMKTDFISVTSHQLRTPLTGIKWFAEVLLAGSAGELSEAQKDSVSQILVSVERMVRLVNDLLEVSRMEIQEGYKLKLQNVSVNNVLNEVISEQKVVFENKKQKIHFNPCTDDKIRFNVDSIKLKAVFNNLLNNAMKYSPDHSIISVVCDQKPNEVVISFQDHGLGIPKKQQKEIFKRFFRADNVLTTDTGTGLGLYFAKFIVEKHKGRIWFESQEGKGSTFYIALPLIKPKTTKK